KAAFTDGSTVSADTAFLMESVPEECLSPRSLVDVCGYYISCLHAAAPFCENSSAPYALTYGHKFCATFAAEAPSFTSDGQAWITATRACLQDAFNLWHQDGTINGVAVGRTSKGATSSYVVTSCGALRSVAFSSHEFCYLGGSTGTSSVCNI